MISIKLAAMFCIGMLFSNNTQMKPHAKHAIPIQDYITQLKFRLAILHAEKAALQGTFELNAGKCLLIAIGCFSEALERFNEIFEFTNSSTIRNFNVLYVTLVSLYYYIKTFKYIFKDSEILAIERELDTLYTRLA